MRLPSHFELISVESILLKCYISMFMYIHTHTPLPNVHIPLKVRVSVQLDEFSPNEYLCVTGPQIRSKT